MRATSDVVYQLATCHLQHAARSTQISCSSEGGCCHTAASGIPRTCATCNVQHTHTFSAYFTRFLPLFLGLRKVEEEEAEEEEGKTRKRRWEASASVACHIAVASNAIKIMRQLPAARTGCLLSNCRLRFGFPISRLLLIPSCDFCDFCEPAVWHVWHDVCAALKQKAHSAHMCDDRGGMRQGCQSRAGQEARQGEGRQAESKRPCQHAASCHRCHGCYFEQEAPPIIKT